MVAEGEDMKRLGFALVSPRRHPLPEVVGQTCSSGPQLLGSSRQYPADRRKSEAVSNDKVVGCFRVGRKHRLINRSAVKQKVIQADKRKLRGSKGGTSKWLGDDRAVRVKHSPGHGQT